MKVITLNQAGNTEKLQFTQANKPIIKSHEVLVKVVSISINPVDVNARASHQILNWIFGEHKPVILGWDISGEVIEVGENVSKFKIGDKVFGMVNFFGKGNAYAEYVAAPESHLALKPKNMTHQQAAASAMVGCTAYQALVEVAKIKKNDRVLIHGASGGVGHMAVQIAKSFGAYVIATSSAKNKDFVLSLGADEHIDYLNENLIDRAKNIDIVLDTIQGETLINSINIIKPGGIIVTIPTPEIPQLALDTIEKKQGKIEFMMVTSKNETIEAIAKLLENEIIKPNIHKIYAFNEMANAHLEVETKRVVGKVVVNI